MDEEKLYRVAMRIDSTRDHYYLRMNNETATALKDLLITLNLSFDWSKDFVAMEAVTAPKEDKDGG